MFWQHHPLQWLILIVFLGTSTAAEFNRTIDDTLGDSVTGEKPIYLPSTVGVWQDADCKGCLLQPDRILAFNGTWTAATYTPTIDSMSVELAFKGTAIYVFFILANIVEQGNPTETACNFTLDGLPAGKFQHLPAPTNEFLFDSLVFSQNNLSNIDHRLSISTSGLDRKVWVNFDYAIYTTDDTPSRPPPSSSSSSQPSQATSPTPPSTPSAPPPRSERPGSQTGVIVGAVVGTFVTLLVLVSALFFLYRRKRRVTRDDDEFPIALSPIRQYNDSNAQFVTPFANPYMDQSLAYPESSQPLAIFPLATHPDFPGGVPAMAPTNAPTFRTKENRMPINTGAGAEESALSFVPLVLVPDPLQDQIAEAVRRERQAEIGRQMETLRQNMRYLKATGPFHRRPAEGRRSGGTNMSSMKDEIRVLREQIEYLQAQQQSPWAQGLSDEPPPGYSAASPSH